MVLLLNDNTKAEFAELSVTLIEAGLETSIANLQNLSEKQIRRLASSSAAFFLKDFYSEVYKKLRIEEENLYALSRMLPVQFSPETFGDFNRILATLPPSKKTQTLLLCSIVRVGAILNNFRFYWFFGNKTGSGYFQGLVPNIFIKKLTISRRLRAKPLFTDNFRF